MESIESIIEYMLRSKVRFRAWYRKASPDVAPPWTAVHSNHYRWYLQQQEGYLRVLDQTFWYSPPWTNEGDSLYFLTDAHTRLHVYDIFKPFADRLLLIEHTNKRHGGVIWDRNNDMYTEKTIEKLHRMQDREPDFVPMTIK